MSAPYLRYVALLALSSLTSAGCYVGPDELASGTDATDSGIGSGDSDGSSSSGGEGGSGDASSAGSTDDSAGGTDDSDSSTGDLTATDGSTTGDDTTTGDATTGDNTTTGDSTTTGDGTTTGDDSTTSGSTSGSTSTTTGGMMGAYCDADDDWMGSWATLEEEVVVVVNQKRSQGADCGSEGSFGAAGPLTMNPLLQCAARLHSMDMVVRGFFNHTNPDGESPWDRIAKTGYGGYANAGENIAAGSATAAAVVDQWMDSDGHCANIMNAQFNEIGVGYYPGGQYGHYWTQVFTKK